MAKEERQVRCTCGSEMTSMGKMEIQLGRHTFLFGDLGNLLSGALPVEIMICPACKRLEFYHDENISEDSDIGVVRCESCGKWVHHSYETCPHCGKKIKSE